MKKTIFMIIGAILLAAGVILFVAVAAQNDFDFRKLGNAKYETNTYPLEDDFQEIEIQTDVSDVDFLPAEDGKCTVISKAPEKVQQTVAVEAGRLKITVTDQRNWIDRFTVFSFDDMRVTVYLPKNEYKVLQIDTDTGDIHIPSNFAFGNVDMKTDTGDIESSATVSGSCKIQTETGDVKVQETRLGMLDFTSSTGHIELNEITCEGDISIKESTGKAKLVNVTCKSLSSEGNTGDISMKNVLAADQFSIKTNTGDVSFEDSDAMEILVKTNTGDVTGTLRTEKVFFMTSDTGDIAYPKTMSGGKCEITTDTGDIKIELVSE